MDSYEVISRVINFNKPPRIGFNFEQIGVSDYLYVGNHILLKKWILMRPVKFFSMKIWSMSLVRYG